MTDSPPANRPKISVRFGWKEAAALMLWVAIAIVVAMLQEPIRQWDELSYIGVFGLTLVTNATVILPAPGLVVVFTLGATLNPWLLGVVAGVGAALGEGTGYLAGYSGSGLVVRSAAYERIKQRLHRHGLWAVFVLAAVPNPIFDLAGIAAGALRLVWWRFLAVTILGKVLKMICVALAGKYSVGWIETLLH